MTEKEFKRRFIAARRAVIEGEYSNLNPEQRRAVMATEGPLLLLAGAGSGKTTVLIHRIANLIKYGSGADTEEIPLFANETELAFLEEYAKHPDPAGEERALRLCAWEPAAPWSIIAITFTNKAANELKERLSRMLGSAAEDVWASTFHSACVRILRRDIDRLGFPRNFTIYDSSDSERLMKAVVKDLNLDDKTFPAKMVLGYVGRAKDRRLTPEEYEAETQKAGDYRLIRVARAYGEYQKRLREAGALDFDDIISHTVDLLLRFEEVRSYYQKKFRYVLIDEYQDTNHSQYLLASLLAGGRKNICVVGDDDQSIYRFRGATIENILSFEQQYRGARVIRLEQNYRSTGNILEASNAVIRNNLGRKGKELWTDQAAGEPVTVYTAMNEHDEAQYVAGQILAAVSRGENWRDNAVLYRMNAQSNQMEYAFKRNGIPYRIFGGTRFFDRAEVKDMLAYLAAVNNPADDLRVKRIVNMPPRGIGAKTVETAEAIALAGGLPFLTVAAEAGRHPELERSAVKLEAFAALITGLRELAATLPLPEFYDEAVTRTGYLQMLEAKPDAENRSRAENVNELKSSIVNYMEGDPEPSLSGFLDEIALYTDLDDRNGEDNAVVMMTIHSAKGLEFPNVFLVGAEEGVFPGVRAIGEPEEMEEERRLCYVAMTRAKEKLTVTCARQRMLFGHTTSNRISRFVGEVPEKLLHRMGHDPLAEHGVSRFPADGAESGEAARRPGMAAHGTGYGVYAARTERAGRPARPGGLRGGGAAPAKAAAPLPSFQKGDMLEHKAFGKGMVVSVQNMGGDALLEIAFDRVGTKRLMAKSASQYMTKL